ncbi:MAG TPA: MFS transporter [Candidatus Dormibacteraeota bacterium]|nr:MFS transporter [Candidatus Dormibacteraeota bacterium]
MRQKTMYATLRGSPAVLPRQQAERPGAPRLSVSRNVVFLGLTSFFTDISSEMVSTVLPIYLLFTLRVAAVQLGVVDGLYQGVTALVQLGAGRVADRGQHKQVAMVGYGLSGLAKLGLLAAGGAVGPLVGIILADRTGKGIRTAPRDALISLSSNPAQLGTAFGVHRALDTAGALAGPLIAFGLLALLPGRFDAIWVVSACFAGLGLATLALLVKGRPTRPSSPGRTSLRVTLTLLNTRRFRTLVLAGGGLGLVTISDAFVYLTMQRQLGFDARLLPLLYVAVAFAYLMLAVPMGRLADRWRRQNVLLVGYVLLLFVYLALLLPGLGAEAFVASLLAFGAFYACTDGVFSAMTTAVLPEDRRATGLALLLTVVALSRLGGSVLYGALWTLVSVRFATGAFMVGLLIALPIAAVGLAKTNP